jgi:GTP cyclohydrolase I
MDIKLITKANGNLPRTEQEKEYMIEQAAEYYGKFLTSLGFDWAADPHSANTPKRVAKAWINDLIAGSIGAEPVITSFPNDQGYTGLICQTKIPVISMCSHHNLQFIGLAHVAYIPGKDKTDKVIGLSKLNRIVDFYSRRPQVQESLTKQIHDHVNELCVGNRGVAVIIESTHNCVRCRGLNHESVMKTSQLSGYFFTNELGTRTELFSLIENNRL